MTKPRAAAVVLAGGTGTRVGAGQNKVYLPLTGRPVLLWSLSMFARMPEIGPLLLVVRPEESAAARRLLDSEGLAQVEMTEGGATRQESELSGLNRLATRIGDGSVDAVLVHDGARPMITEALTRAVLAAAREYGGAVPGVPRNDLAVTESDGCELGDRLAGPAPAGLVAVQTPQGFRAAPALAACAQALREGFRGTDTAACVERFSDVVIRWVPGDEGNIKITYPDDLRVAEQVLAGRPGSGTDARRLGEPTAPGRPASSGGGVDRIRGDRGAG